MPGCVFWFCAEWRRARRVVQLDQLEPESRGELLHVVSGSGEVPRDTFLARHHDLGGWKIDAADAHEVTALLERGQGRRKSAELRLPHSQPRSKSPPPPSAAGRTLSGLAVPTFPRPSMPPDTPESRSCAASPVFSPRPSHKDPERHRGNGAAMQMMKTVSMHADGAATVHALEVSNIRPTNSMPSSTSPSPSRQQRGGSLANVTRKMLLGARAAFTLERSTTNSRPQHTAPGVPLAPGVQLLFLQPRHPLAGIREECTRDEFVAELRSRLSTERLFGASAKGLGVQPTLSVVEAEDLFDALALMQTGGCGAANKLQLGKAFDSSVDRFFALVRFRQLMERRASCPSDFFQRLDLDKSQNIALNDIVTFMQTGRNEFREPADRPAGQDPTVVASATVKFAENVFAALDINKDGRVEAWEFQQGLSLAAPPRLSLATLVAHLEMKHGSGQSGLNGQVDRSMLFEHLCGRESLDLAPEDVVRCYRAAKSTTAKKPQGKDKEKEEDVWSNDVDALMRALPVDLTWGLEPIFVDQYYCALGTRALMLERARRRDACMNQDALLESRDKMPDEDTLLKRFSKLWDSCVVVAPGVKDPSVQAALKDLRQGCFKRYTAAAKAAMDWRAARAAESAGRHLARHFTGPRSLFSNIGDVLATPSHCLYASQAIVVRFRLQGAANFWHQQHTVLKNEREPIAWPPPQQALGDTPFIGLVPRGLKFTSAGGGGFYLGKQPFTMVDPHLRAELPRDESGHTAHFGFVEITAPSLLRTDRSEGSAQGLVGEFELRLFCASKSRIVGSIGEPLPVCVVHQVRPPPLQSCQAHCEGTAVTIRWSTLDLGPSSPKTAVDAVRLLRTGGSEPVVEVLDPDVTEREFADLLPDTEYEFRVRLENRAGPGREASVLCRTNGFCSEPTHLTSIMNSTAFVDLQWSRPKTLGNEGTRDPHEGITHYEASLKVEDDADDQEDDEGAPPERICKWARGSWREDKAGHVIVRLSTLRPDTRYLLHGLCAVNSMGKGSSAKSLCFWTIPQISRMSSIRVKQGVVLIALTQLLPSTITECSVSVFQTSTPETAVTFKVEATSSQDVPGTWATELPLAFEAMPFVEHGDSHSFRLRTKNAGGWSDWSPPLETEAISRQQGADRAQAMLETAMNSRRIDQLESVLVEVSDIELPEESIRADAESLLQTLKDTKTDLAVAVEDRDPITLRAVLTTARSVKLPELGRAQMLLRKLDSALHRLNNARGIEALRGALKAAHEVRLPARLLQQAVERLGTREACQSGLEHAMEAKRVPVLEFALESSEGMFLPLEQTARALLASLRNSEEMLRAAIQNRIITELVVALEAVAESGLNEEELIQTGSELLRSLKDCQDAARNQLRQALERRHPDQLRSAIDAARAAQVPAEEHVEGDRLLAHVEGLITRMTAAEGIQERSTSVSDAAASRLPEELLRVPREQLERLETLHAAMAGGDLETLRRALRAADQRGLKEAETLDGRLLLNEWRTGLRDADIALACNRMRDLDTAVRGSRSSGVSEKLLEPYGLALKQLEQRAGAEKKLRKAMDACKGESLQKALKGACDAEVADMALVSEARCLWGRLTHLRAELTAAMESMDLQTLADAVSQAKTEPALPDKELSRAEALLQELQEGEENLITGKLELNDDFRILDAFLERAKRSKAAGVRLDKFTLTTASRKVVVLQELDRKKLDVGLLDQRTHNSFPRWIEDIPVSQRSLPMPEEVVFGEVDVEFEPRSLSSCVLPREIVELLLVVSHEEEAAASPGLFKQDGTPGAVARKLLDVLRHLVASEDEVHHRPVAPVPGVSRDDAYETGVSIYVRACHTAADIAEALSESKADVAWQSDAAEDAQGAEGAEESAPEVQSRANNSKRSARRARTLDPSKIEKAPRRSEVANSLAQELSRHMAKTATTSGVLRSKLHEQTRTVQLASGHQLVDYLHQVRSRVLRRVSLEVSWSTPPGAQSVSLACVAFDGERLVEIVDSKGSHGEDHGAQLPLLAKGGSSPDGTMGTVQHGGESQCAEKGRRQQEIRLRVDLIPQHIMDLVFVLTADSGLAKCGTLRASMVDSDRSRVLATCDLENGGGSGGEATTSRTLSRIRPSTPTKRSPVATPEAAIVCTLHRGHNGLWHFHSCGSSCQSSQNEYGLVLNKLVELGYPRNVSMRMQVPMILMGMMQELKLEMPVKSTAVTLGTTCRIKVSYAIELFKGGPDGKELERRLAEEGFRGVLSKALRGAVGSRLGEATVEVLPAAAKPLRALRAELRWKFREDAKGRRSAGRGGFLMRSNNALNLDIHRQKDEDFSMPRQISDNSTKSAHSRRDQGNFMDGACICFDGQALREVVDYRGPNGVRLVSNGVVDYRGVWSGLVGFGDATAGAVKHVGESIKEATLEGKHSIEMSLDKLPDSISDMYLVLSEPTGGDVSQFKDVRMVLLNGEDPGHEIANLKVQANEASEALVVSRLSRVDKGRGWRLDDFGSHVQGDARNYRPMLLCLRAIQEARHRAPPQWPYLAIGAAPHAGLERASGEDSRPIMPIMRKQGSMIVLPRLPVAELSSQQSMLSQDDDDDIALSSVVVKRFRSAR